MARNGSSAVQDNIQDFECDRVGYSYKTRGRTITESDIVVHAGQTGDLFPIHLDAEAAKASPYGQRIAHGTLTLSIAVGLKFTTDPTMGLRISYGYDRVRFRKPVFIGDTIHCEVEVTKSEIDPQRPNMRRVIEQTTVMNQRGEAVLSINHILVRWLD
jgi:monoamine oxidase